VKKVIKKRGKRMETNEGSEQRRRMLNLDEVLDIVPVARSTLFRMEKNKQFPECVYISENRRVWFEDEVLAWQAGLTGLSTDGRKKLSWQKARKGKTDTKTAKRSRRP
jgi:predicted DNA-binding transcriptional regulator AlpA